MAKLSKVGSGHLETTKTADKFTMNVINQFINGSVLVANVFLPKYQLEKVKERWDSITMKHPSKELLGT